MRLEPFRGQGTSAGRSTAHHGRDPHRGPHRGARHCRRRSGARLHGFQATDRRLVDREPGGQQSGHPLYLGRGNVPGRGPYRDLLARAKKFLLASQQPSGLFVSPRGSHGPMYEHALSTLACAEMYGMDPDPELEDKLRKAVDLILKAQSPNGGWRYQPQPGDHDLSVTVMQIVALRAANNAEIPVPRDHRESDRLRQVMRVDRAVASPISRGRPPTRKCRRPGYSHCNCWASSTIPASDPRWSSWPSCPFGGRTRG